MTDWFALDKRFRPEHLGFLPDILLADDRRPVREQLDDRYAHGGGWRPIKGFRLNKKTNVLTYPGYQPYKPAALTVIGKETVIFYPRCSLLMVVQPDDSWEITRVD